MKRWDDLELLAALILGFVAAWIGVIYGGVISAERRAGAIPLVGPPGQGSRQSVCSPGCTTGDRDHMGAPEMGKAVLTMVHIEFRNLLSAALEYFFSSPTVLGLSFAWLTGLAIFFGLMGYARRVR